MLHSKGLCPSQDTVTHPGTQHTRVQTANLLQATGRLKRTVRIGWHGSCKEGEAHTEDGVMLLMLVAFRQKSGVSV